MKSAPFAIAFLRSKSNSSFSPVLKKSLKMRIEETGYQVEIKEKVCSAETYCKHPTIGNFHPIQVYYSGQLVKKIKEPMELDHMFRWVEYETIKGKMYLEMQNWAIEQVWNLR